ncbi:MAG: alpha/beta hydrolase [Clostridiales bacterium]|jgi:pimeloyl-ACP methyl ester carboxylesterase|nr:alpha/beta hydrolase [Clostridiales bacterium]
MAEFYLGGKKVYYETYGTGGEPILLLNGIMMSAKSWTPFIENFSRFNRLILMDFFDQGGSARMTGAYDHAIQIAAIEGLLAHLKLSVVNICGVSYGAEVGLGFAVKHPDKVRRLALFNGGARTAPLLRDIGRAWNEAARAEGGLAYYLAAIPVIYSDSYYENHADRMANRQKNLVPYFGTQEVKERLIRLTDSSENFNVVDKLGALGMPVLIVTAADDYLIPLREQEIMAEGIKHAHRVILPACGHASMYEQPLLFSALTLGFINSQNGEFVIQ